MCALFARFQSDHLGKNTATVESVMRRGGDSRHDRGIIHYRIYSCIREKGGPRPDIRSAPSLLRPPLLYPVFTGAIHASLSLGSRMDARIVRRGINRIKIDGIKFTVRMDRLKKLKSRNEILSKNYF